MNKLRTDVVPEVSLDAAVGLRHEERRHGGHPQAQRQAIQHRRIVMLPPLDGLVPRGPLLKNPHCACYPARVLPAGSSAKWSPERQRQRDSKLLVQSLLEQV